MAARVCDRPRYRPGSGRDARIRAFVLLIPWYPSCPFPAYGRPRGLAKKRKLGALGLGFNKNFPLAFGHSSRALRFQNSSKPFGLIPSAPEAAPNGAQRGRMERLR